MSVLTNFHIDCSNKIVYNENSWSESYHSFLESPRPILTLLYSLRQAHRHHKSGDECQHPKHFSPKNLVNKRITNFIPQSSSDLIIVNILTSHSKGQKLASEI